MIRSVNTKLFFLFMFFTLFLSSYSRKRHHFLEHHRLNASIQCVAPVRLVHYRRLDHKFPCYVKCKLGPYKYCPPGKLLFCDKGDRNCECEAPAAVCDPPDLHRFQYLKSKCHCKFNIPTLITNSITMTSTPYSD